jgi:hypothetical protein
VAVGRIQRRLAQLEGVTRAVVPPRSGWDLALLDDDELEELVVLARKAEGTRRTGRTVVWSPVEEAVLAKLSAKPRRDGSASAKATT